VPLRRASCRSARPEQIHTFISRYAFLPVWNRGHLGHLHFSVTTNSPSSLPCIKASLPFERVTPSLLSNVYSEPFFPPAFPSFSLHSDIAFPASDSPGLDFAPSSVKSYPMNVLLLIPTFIPMKDARTGFRTIGFLVRDDSTHRDSLFTSPPSCKPGTLSSPSRRALVDIFRDWDDPLFRKSSPFFGASFLVLELNSFRSDTSSFYDRLLAQIAALTLAHPRLPLAPPPFPPEPHALPFL